MAGGAELGKTVGDVGGLDRAGCRHVGHAVGIGGEGELDARGCAVVDAAARGGLEVEEVFDEIARLSADAAHEGEYIAMAAEVVDQMLDVGAHIVAEHVALMLQVDAHIGALEAVDALLGVAHGAQMALVGTGNAFDHVDLQLARVLEFVDHDELEAVGVGGRDLRMAVQGAQGEGDEACHVDKAARGEQVAVGGFDVAGQVDDQVEPARGMGELEGGLGVAERLPQGLGRFGVVLPVVFPIDEILQQSLLVAWGGGGQHGVAGCDGLFRGGVLDLVLFGVVVEGCFGQGQQLAGKLAGRSGRGAEGNRVETCGLVGDHVEDVGHLGVELVGLHLAEEVAVGVFGRFFCARDHLVEGEEPDVGRIVVACELEGRVEPKLEGMFVKNAVAHAMNRRNPGAVDLQGFVLHAFGAQGLADAVLDLASGLVGEGDDKGFVDARKEGGAVRARPGHQSPGDALGECKGLARTGACADEQGAVEIGDARPLSRAHSRHIHG